MATPPRFLTVVATIAAATSAPASAQPATALTAPTPGAPPRVLPAGESLALPGLESSVGEPKGHRFMGSPGLRAEVTALYTSDGFVLRPCGTLRLGPITVCLGALIGEETKFNLQVDVVSFQSNGWEIALGGGFLGDYGTLRAGVPILSWLRGRAMFSGGSYGLGGGLGVEVSPW